MTTPGVAECPPALLSSGRFSSRVGICIQHTNSFLLLCSNGECGRLEDCQLTLNHFEDMGLALLSNSSDKKSANANPCPSLPLTPFSFFFPTASGQTISILSVLFVHMLIVR